MADYYLDEYLKKYATGRRVEYIKFMKLKASFLRLKDINRDQNLILKAIKEADSFYNEIPKIQYIGAIWARRPFKGLGLATIGRELSFFNWRDYWPILIIGRKN